MSVSASAFTHWLYFVVILMNLVIWGSVVISFGKILKRTGHAPAWSLLTLLPPCGIIALWIFAFKPWPIDKKPEST